MAVNYGNTVYQVRAKNGNGSTVEKGFCDILQLRIPMYLCVRNALGLGNRKSNGSENDWKIRENQWATEEGAEPTLVKIYNAIPKNTLEFCEHYYTKFKKFPAFDLFLYEAKISEDEDEEEEKRAYLEDVNGFITGELSTLYFLQQERNVSHGSLLKSFLSGSTQEQEFTLKYGLKNETGSMFQLSNAYIVKGADTYNLRFAKGDATSASTEINHPFDEAKREKPCIYAFASGKDPIKLFEWELVSSGELGGGFKSIKLTKAGSLGEGDLGPVYFTMYYTMADHEHIPMIIANDDIVLDAQPMLQPWGEGQSQYYVGSFAKTIVTPNITFSFDEESTEISLAENRASICYYTLYTTASETATNGSSESPVVAVELAGDDLMYEIEEEATTNDGGGGDVREAVYPIFYLDETLNLPEFWKNTPETTL